MLKYFLGCQEYISLETRPAVSIIFTGHGASVCPDQVPLALITPYRHGRSWKLTSSSKIICYLRVCVQRQWTLQIEAEDLAVNNDKPKHDQ